MFTLTHNPLLEAFDEIFSYSKPTKKELPEKLTIEVPGFNKDNISITIKNGYLYLQGDNGNKKISKYLYVGSNVDTKNAKASVKDGILEIELKEDKSKDIEISIS